MNEKRDWSWAVKHLREGKKVRRRLWPSNQWIVKSILCINDYYNRSYVVTGSDVTSEDWELYEEEKEVKEEGIRLWQVLRDMKKGEEYSYGKDGIVAEVTGNKKNGLWLRWKLGGKYVSTECDDRYTFWYKIEEAYEECTYEEAKVLLEGDYPVGIVQAYDATKQIWEDVMMRHAGEVWWVEKKYPMIHRTSRRWRKKCR